MKLHLHIGPGHHEEILMEQLRRNEIDFSYSNYYPQYQFSQVSGGKSTVLHHSKKYEFTNYLTWGISNKLKVLRRQNKHYMVTYPVYDKITANHLNDDLALAFCWAQVSLHTIRKARRMGKITVLDYPIPHISTWTDLLEEEAVLNMTDSLHSQFSQGMIHRMIGEIEEADYISVPSEFVKNSFLDNGVAESKLIFNPYGIDSAHFNPERHDVKALQGRKKLKVIFVGSIEFRKGVQYLLEATTALNPDDIELHLIGTIHEDFRIIYGQHQHHPHIKWAGQLNRSQVAEEMATADVMVMPSILEGLSLTILECMASGTPVISTTNAGGLGVIAHDEDGWIIPIRDVNAIRSQIEWCIRHKEKLPEMGNRARMKVLSNYDHQHYGDRFINKVYSLIK